MHEITNAVKLDKLFDSSLDVLMQPSFVKDKEKQSTPPHYVKSRNDYHGIEFH